MKRIIPFVRYRYLWFCLSGFMIVFGISGGLLTNGYRLGLDFKGGLSQEIQIAPVAFRIVNTSTRVINFNLIDNEVNYIKAGEKKMIIARAPNQTLADLAKSLEATGDFKVTLAETPDFIGTLWSAHAELDPQKELVVNHRLPAGAKPTVTISALRSLLGGVFTTVSLQEVGDPINQDFMIQVDPNQFEKSATAAQDASDLAARAVIGTLEKEFGPGTVMERQRESVGPQLAQSFAVGSITAIIVALVLMLIYVSFRFRFNYAVASIIALVHDTLSTIGFIGLFHIEINTATVAAILTIIGYSMNDTIVIFDRIRENEKLMKGQDLGFIMDSSITQTLNRSIYTHVTTFIAIFPLFILGSGPVKDFSACMLFGIVVGAYSSVFNASPIVLIWQKAIDRAVRKKELRLNPMAQMQPAGPEMQALDQAGPAVTGEAGSTAPGGTPEKQPFMTTGTGPITRVQRVLEKKKKKRH